MEQFIKDNKDKVNQLLEYISNHDNESELINVLHHAQDIFGYLPREVQKIISEGCKVSLAHVNGVVTFYSYFSEKKKGNHHISVCTGTACFVKGAKQLTDYIETNLKLRIGQTTDDGLFSYVEARCVGACGLAPVVMINDEVHGNMTVDKLNKLLKEYKDK